MKCKNQRNLRFECLSQTNICLIIGFFTNSSPCSLLSTLLLEFYLGKINWTCHLPPQTPPIIPNIYSTKSNSLEPNLPTSCPKSPSSFLPRIIPTIFSTYCRQMPYLNALLFSIGPSLCTTTLPHIPPCLLAFSAIHG